MYSVMYTETSASVKETQGSNFQAVVVHEAHALVVPQAVQTYDLRKPAAWGAAVEPQQPCLYIA